VIGEPAPRPLEDLGVAPSHVEEREQQSITSEPSVPPSHEASAAVEASASDEAPPDRLSLGDGQAVHWQSDPPSLGLSPVPASPADSPGLALAPESVAASSATTGHVGAFQEATVQPDPRLKSPSIAAALKEELVAWVKTLLSAAVYAVLIVTFGVQVARVEGQSMAPTLEDQDRLIVNKLVYRIGEPRRGDIVMLYYPLNPDKSFVKRVIAEESDTVRIVDGRVYVNDIPLKDDYVSNEYRSHDDWGPQVIPEGYYFVMGDHRNNSSDSRHWGMVPKRYIIGKVQLRWWPVPTARVF
jgi:signal peptidase I